MRNVLVFLGGESSEYEVSVITGFQVIENMDRTLYNPIPVFVSVNGEFSELVSFKDRRDFFSANLKPIYFGFDEKKQAPFCFNKNSKDQREIYCVYNTLHGGGGEYGQIAGFCESLKIPYTSTNVESSAICMNKSLAKLLVGGAGISVLPSLSFASYQIKNDVKKIAKIVNDQIGFPIIIKPVHMGSSIGIKIAKDITELELGFLESSHVDTEVLAEKFLPEISEFNCSVRTHNGEISVSDVERPISKEEILSFKDKYEREGGKRGGMASLSRELPANISKELYTKIQSLASEVYQICKCKGVVRIDFIQSKEGEIYFNEINPIPGSMAYYLWETQGISFKQQITDLVEESVKGVTEPSLLNTVHSTDIIPNFIKNYKS